MAALNHKSKHKMALNFFFGKCSIYLLKAFGLILHNSDARIQNLCVALVLEEMPS